MEKNYNKNLIQLLFLVLIVFFTNNYFNFENSLIFGGSDGQFYFLISKYAPNFGINIEYIKGERFFLPYVIGIISKLGFVDLYLLYQITSIILVIILIFLFHEILILSKIDKYTFYIALLLVIFNPYLIRYYLAVPTIVVDLIFIISLEIISIGFLKKQKKFLYLGLILAALSRQNSIIILFVFFLLKFFFKNKSIFQYKDLFLASILFTIIFCLNTFYAINSSGDIKEVENLYFITLFGILIIDYSLIDLLRYLYFPLLGFGPLIAFILIMFHLKKFVFKNSEFILFYCLVSLLIIGIAFVGGPNTTGKNIIRLANFAYIYLILIVIHCFPPQKIKDNMKKVFVPFGSLIVLWSFHPTFSKIKIWKFLSNIINF